MESRSFHHFEIITWTSQNLTCLFSHPSRRLYCVHAMASSTANILKEDWEKHKAIIMQLYSERGLPLIRRNDAEKDQCVDWIMRNQHGFSASKWQYENQLKKWGIAKNLKQDEWVSLLAHHDLLETQGKEVRIVISGKVQTKERIRKARHRYCGSPAARLHRSPQGLFTTVTKIVNYR
ncbi:hypothetical protein PG990_010701 [Apiospora arundinis]